MTTSKPITVATNDSPQGQAAVLWAARRAERAGLPLVILHVVDDRWAAEPYPWTGVLEEAGDKLLQTAAGRIRGTIPISVTTRLLIGSIGGSLAKYSGKASMVVVGSGAGHLGGSLADRALQVAAFAAAEADREGDDLTVVYAISAGPSHRCGPADNRAAVGGAAESNGFFPVPQPMASSSTCRVLP